MGWGKAHTYISRERQRDSSLGERASEERFCPPSKLSLPSSELPFHNLTDRSSAPPLARGEGPTRRSLVEVVVEGLFDIFGFEVGASATFDPLCEFINPLLSEDKKLNCGVEAAIEEEGVVGDVLPGEGGAGGTVGGIGNEGPFRGGLVGGGGLGGGGDPLGGGGLGGVGGIGGVGGGGLGVGGGGIGGIGGGGIGGGGLRKH